MSAVVYDAGALVAAERNDRRMWAEHRVRLELGFSVAVPAPVLAQVSRSPKQVQLRRLLSGCEVVEFEEADAHDAGRILARSKTNDIVDASVVVLAMRRRADIVTGDEDDLSKLATAAGARARILAI
jgi:predicted nucleic acid-binding protein